MRRPERIVQAETDDTFWFTLEFVNGGMATMIASFAATPARGAKIVVMGDRRHARSPSRPGPNPMDDGVVVASREGAPLAPLATPRGSPFTRTRAIIG